MDLSSRCVRPGHLHSNPVLLDQHGLPTHFSALGLLAKPPPRLDDTCLTETVVSRDLNRYYSQPPPPLPIDPMKYRYSGHSSSQTLLSRGTGGEVTNLLSHHPSDRPPFPPYRPGPVPSMHPHLTAFHAQLGSHSEPTSSLSGDMGMHLTLLSPLQRQDESGGSVSHMPMPPISHSNLPPIPPPTFSMSRPVELYRLLNTTSPNVAPHSVLPSSSGVAASEHDSCGISSLGLNHTQPQTICSEANLPQRSGLLHGPQDIGHVVLPQVQSNSFHLPLPVSKEFHSLSKEFTDLSDKPSNETLQCSDGTELPDGDGETDLLTVDEDETSSSESSDQSSIDESPAMSQIPEENASAIVHEETAIPNPNLTKIDEATDTPTSDVKAPRLEIAKDGDQDCSDDNTPVKYLNRVVFCQVCRKGYGNAAALEKHMKSHGPHRCTVCNRSFPRPCNLKTHMAVHADRTFFCEECGKSYKSMSSLQMHKTTVHLSPETGNVVCDACGVVLKNRKSLLQHEQMHTRGKRYSCDLCDERFNRKDALNRHVVRIHVEERFFNCQVCGTQCNTNEALQDHMWTHDAERPHECSCCKRRFPQRSALERHLRSHTGMRHACSVCGTAFTRSYRLKFHMQRHHPTERSTSFENKEDSNENCGITVNKNKE